jgi:hypothetical protein
MEHITSMVEEATEGLEVGNAKKASKKKTS